MKKLASIIVLLISLSLVAAVPTQAQFHGFGGSGNPCSGVGMVTLGTGVMDVVIMGTRVMDVVTLGTRVMGVVTLGTQVMGVVIMDILTHTSIHMVGIPTGMDGDGGILIGMDGDG